jgi:hypothetical protein
MQTVTLTLPIFEDWTWPLAAWTLHALYLASGILIALHYAPQIRLAWLNHAATAVAQSLSTWITWTLCRVVAFTYGVFVLHDLVFLIVVGADILGRLAMVGLIMRARLLARGISPLGSSMVR